jgi:hypothetical protein
MRFPQLLVGASFKDPCADNVRIVAVILQGDHLIRGVCREGRVQVWAAAYPHTLHRVLHAAFSRLFTPLTGARITPDGHPFG